MTDRELLTELLEVINSNIDMEWIHDDSTPSEEFEYIYDLIVQHLEKEPTWDLK